MVGREQILDVCGSGDRSADQTMKNADSIVMVYQSGDSQ